MDYNEKAPFEQKYFISSNSSKGFYNGYPACFGERSGIDRLYVIKGGPGTGKSHFLRSVGQCAEAHGYHATYYYCSSDPASLDGLIVEAEGKPRMGFLDGTAPHVWEPTAPGIRDEIINLGIFWSSAELRLQKAEINRVGGEKSKCYQMAYRFLSACGEITAATETLIRPCVDIRKLKLLAARLLRSQPKGRGFSETSVFTRCVSMSGCATFDTLEGLSAAQGGELVRIDECYGVGYELTACLYALAKKQQLRVTVSCDPIHTHRIDGLYFPDSGACFLVDDGENKTALGRRVTLRRYLDPTAFKEIRGKVRHDLKLAEEMKERACHCLRKAGEHHFALERIYAAAMDFEAKERFEKAFCRELFS